MNRNVKNDADSLAHLIVREFVRLVLGLALQTRIAFEAAAASRWMPWVLVPLCLGGPAAGVIKAYFLH